MRATINCLILLCLVLVAAPAHAGLLLDRSPLGALGTISPGAMWSYLNTAGDQNFAEKVLFETDVRITGMSIYTYSYFAGGVSRDVAVRRWTESGNALDAASLIAFDTVLSDMDTDGIGNYPGGGSGVGVRAHADFGANSFLLTAHTPLWIGMTGIPDPLAPINLGLFGLDGLRAPADGQMWKFMANESRGLVPSGDMAMRIYGEPVTSPAVPEPASLLLLATGLGAVAARPRSRKLSRV